MIVPLALFAAVPLRAVAEPPTFANPLDAKVADPDIILWEGTYYLYGTLADPRRVVEGFPVWTSQDLVDWRERGLALRNAGDRWGQFWFWGPDLVRHGGRWLMYYGAFRQAGGARVGRICVAQSESPLGPFTDVRAPLFETDRGDAIDAEVFVDDDGAAYIFYTITDHGRNTIHVAPLADDRLSLAAEPKQILQPDQPWETYPVNEGAFVTKRGGKYVLLYAANDFRMPDYCVGCATADSPLGPWRKRTPGPVVAQRGDLRGPGCLGLIPSPDGAELFAYYHVHLGPEGYVRQLAIDRARLVEDGEIGVRLEVDGPTAELQPWPSGAPLPPSGRSDDFGAPLDRSRWMVVDEAPESIRVAEGRLHLTTLDGDMHRSRADYRNLLLQHAPPGDFAIAARAFVSAGAEFEQAFICVWQDADNYARLSSVFSGGGLSLDAALEIGGEYVSTSLPRLESGPVTLRIARRGNAYSFAAKEEAGEWRAVGPTREAALRDVRVGLGAISPGSGQRRPAWFDDFVIGPPP
ncbi:MAG: DUF1349 domain-containing protein [Armatimonadetes bacterium]|nr:DUF1349 domain-containing protein [Armatimonadota bacterium]